jgi:hypothetical protein
MCLTLARTAQVWAMPVLSTLIRIAFIHLKKRVAFRMKRNKISTHVLFLFKLFFIPTDEYDAVYYFYGCKITPNIVPM